MSAERTPPPASGGAPSRDVVERAKDVLDGLGRGVAYGSVSPRQWAEDVLAAAQLPAAPPREEIAEIIERLEKLLRDEGLKGLSCSVKVARDITDDAYTTEAMVLNQGEVLIDLLDHHRGDWSETTLELFCEAVNALPTLIAAIRALYPAAPSSCGGDGWSDEERKAIAIFRRRSVGESFTSDDYEARELLLKKYDAAPAHPQPQASADRAEVSTSSKGWSDRDRLSRVIHDACYDWMVSRQQQLLRVFWEDLKPHEQEAYGFVADRIIATSPQASADREGEVLGSGRTQERHSRALIDDILTKEEFSQRFVARLVQLAGETDPDGDSNAEYATGVAEDYWLDRAEFNSPEEAAEVDFSYWEEG